MSSSTLCCSPRMCVYVPRAFVSLVPLSLTPVYVSRAVTVYGCYQ
jgi:hypothetical protein